MADFAFKRQEKADESLETTRVVPLTCHGHTRPISHLAFSPLQNASAQAAQISPQYYLVSACKDNNPMLRDGASGDWIGTFVGHKGAVWNTRLSDDATLAATGSADFSARVWDTFTGECLWELQHNHIVRCVAWAPGPRPAILATAGMEKRLRIWDLSGGVGGTGQNTNGDANGAPNGTANAALNTHQPPSYELGAGEHGGAIKSIVWSHADPSILITAADDKKIRWWDLHTRSCIASYDLDGLPTSCELNASPNGDPAGIISVAAGKNVYFFMGSHPGHLLKHIKTERDVASVALGSSGRFITGSPNDTWVHVWDFETGKEVENGKGHHGPVWTTAYSPDGSIYATGSEDGTIKLWKACEGGYGLWR
ncbi:WD40 repeat-like protein [Polychaeton citri CBS 116435]|uniref:Serine-threonine kinase receptor-associated protein n=1 Tax=Polychaeton citri CBS 116435 TaxID=1314669 RepID=A0A9P4UQ60_9PEZI|nr:WD40 repeat-like protein [Polychaeton citri CBS 116435]